MHGPPGLIDYWSHSRLFTLRQCGLRFMYKYLERRPELFRNPAQALGIAFHAACEERLVRMMAGDEMGLEELVALVNQSLEEQANELPIRFDEGEDRAELLATARRMLEAWLAWPRPSARVIAVEQDFEVELPGAPWLPKLRGRVDLIEVDEAAGFVNVVDLKSSAGRWSASTAGEHGGQIELYKLAVIPLAKDLNLPIRGGFEVITKAKKPVVERHYLEDTPEPIERIIKIATVAQEMIERGLLVPAPPGWYCAGCSYAEPCATWQHEK